MADDDAALERDLSLLEATLAEMTATLGRMQAEEDQLSLRYLIWAADCPVVAELRRQTDDKARHLRELLSRCETPSPDSIAPSFAEPNGQITFEALVAMYRSDRDENPHHWAAG